MRKLLSTLLLSLVVVSAQAAVVKDTVYINNGLFTTVDSNTLPYTAFNSSSTFDQQNTQLFIGVGDSLYLTIINTDTQPHGVDITNTTGYTTTVGAGATTTLACQFNQTGIYILHDHLNYPDMAYFGLSTPIVVDNFAGSIFSWNIKEHQLSFNDSIQNNGTVNWSTYYPEYFTINGNSNPAINADPLAKVTGNVGDTLRICVTNTGQSIHSIHFHGYHLRIVFSSKDAAHVDRVKDTFSVYPMESLILELIPDKTGEYPVHDHNLVAVTGGGIYPNGMFLTMIIQ